ncbi:MAG: D-glucuronyl C5-epimerase family protein [Coriobacteriia bacterium]|nr:D-glucuronyl C5-epimerase family protein [Coriobacteriia bacterium]
MLRRRTDTLPSPTSTRARTLRFLGIALALVMAVPATSATPLQQANAATPTPITSVSTFPNPDDSASVMSPPMPAEELLDMSALGAAEQLWSQDTTDSTPSHYYAWCKSGSFYDHNPRDASGLVMVQYRDLPAPVYNPVTIASYALNYHELWLHDGNVAARDAFLLHARWLRDRGMDAQGRYPYTFATDRGPAPWYSAMAQGMAISAMARAYVYTGDASYLTAANKAFQPFKKNLSEGGVVSQDGAWLEEYPDGYHVLNGAVFAMWGLWDLARISGDPAALPLFEKSSKHLAANLSSYESEGAILYELHPDRFAHPTYHLLHIRQLRALSVLTGDMTFDQYASRWEKDFRAYPAPRFTVRTRYLSSRGLGVTLTGSVKYLFRAYFKDRPALNVTGWPVALPSAASTTRVPLQFTDGYNAQFSLRTEPLMADMDYRYSVADVSTLAGWGCDYPITATGTNAVRQVPATLSDVGLVNNPATPNGDGWNDWVYATYKLGGSEAKVTLRIYDGRGVLKATVPGRVVAGKQTYQWSGTWWTRFDLVDATGAKLPDGLYRWVVEASNSMGSSSASGRLFVSKRLTKAPSLDTAPVLQDIWAAVTPFTPNGDGIDDATHFCFTTTQDAWITIKVYDYRGEVRTVVNNARFRAGRYYPLWNGRDAAGNVLPKGNYAYSIFASGGGNSPATALQSGVVGIR